MITLIMLLAGFDNITPANAATDSYAEPVCSAGWVDRKQGDVLPFDLSDVPGNYSLDFQNGTFKTCPSDSSIRLLLPETGEEYAAVVKVYEARTILRVWFDTLPDDFNFVFYGVSTGAAKSFAWNGNSIGAGTGDIPDVWDLTKWIGIRDVEVETWPGGKYVLHATGAHPIIQIAVSRWVNGGDQHPTPILDANSGAFPDGSLLQTPSMTPNGLGEWTKSNTPTRTGYVFSKWTTDKAGTKPFTSATVSNGLRLYAQWEKDAGDPQKVDLDCSTGGRCELTVNYSGSTAKTREFNMGTKDLSWPGTPIAGVRLDENGYAADGACSDSRCWYVSLEKEPQNPSAYQAQMPTTGAPEGLSMVGLVAFAVGLAGLMLVLARRVRD